MGQTYFLRSWVNDIFNLSMLFFLHSKIEVILLGIIIGTNEIFHRIFLASL